MKKLVPESHSTRGRDPAMILLSVGLALGSTFVILVSGVIFYYGVTSLASKIFTPSFLFIIYIGFSAYLIYKITGLPWVAILREPGELRSFITNLPFGERRVNVITVVLTIFTSIIFLTSRFTFIDSLFTVPKFEYDPILFSVLFLFATASQGFLFPVSLYAKLTLNLPFIATFLDVIPIAFHIVFMNLFSRIINGIYTRVSARKASGS